MGAPLAAGESLPLSRLAQSMADAGVRSLEFRPGVSQADADALLRLLIGEKAAENELAWIGVNRATPAVSDADVSGMSELLQSYAAGLELLRQTAARLRAGGPPRAGPSARRS